MKKKLLSALLAIVMVFSLTIPAMAESAFSDMPQDYSTAALEAAVANGLLKGTDGKILPNDMLTRAQMSAIMVRAFGATKSADISAFADVDKDAWYYAELSKAVYMGIFKGDGKAMNPNNSITRQEAFLVLSRAFNLKTTNAAALDKFADKASVASWAKDGVSAMVEAGYVKGDEKGNINPTAGISRKDFAVTMDRMVKNYISKAGTVTELPEGSVMINVPNVVLKDITVKGNLIIGDGVGEGNVTLDNVKVEGNTIVRGGGVNSFIVKGNSSLGSIIISKVDGNVRIAVEGNAKVEVVEVNDGKDDVIVEGNIAKLEVAASDVPVVVQNAKIGEVTVSAANSNVTVAASAKVETVTVEKTATKTELVVSGTVTNVTASADNTTVSGKGTVTNVKVEEGSGTTITTPGTKVEAGKDASNVTAGDKPVTPEAPVEVPKEEIPPYIPPVDPYTYVGTEEELTAALASSSMIKLSKDIELTKTLIMDKSLTLDLGGKTISVVSGQNCLKPSGNGINITVKNGTVLAADAQAIAIREGANVTVLADATVKGYWGITVMGAGSTLNHKGRVEGGISGNGITKNSGTTINVYPGSVVIGGIYHPQAGTLNISGGTITGSEALSIKDGTVNISGGTFTADGAYKNPAEQNNNGSEDTGACISIINNPIYAETNKSSSGEFDPIEISITGGTFESTNGYALFYGTAYKSGSAVTDKKYVTKLDITGGTFKGNVGKGDLCVEHIPENANVIVPADNTMVIPADKTMTIANGATLTINGALADNGTLTNNGTIVVNDESALKTVLAAGGTVKLGSDIDLHNSIWTPLDMTGVIFDGQNHSISNFKIESNTEYSAFFRNVTNSTVSNIKFTGAEVKGSQRGAIAIGNAKNSTISNLSSAGTVECSGQAAGLVMAAEDCNLTSCSSSANVAVKDATGYSYITAGGVFGQIGATKAVEGYSIEVKDCSFTGTVTVNEAGSNGLWAGQIFGNTYFSNNHTGPIYGILFENLNADGTLTVVPENFENTANVSFYETGAQAGVYKGDCKKDDQFSIYGRAGKSIIATWIHNGATYKTANGETTFNAQ